jgi:hypothetical protein
MSAGAAKRCESANTNIDIFEEQKEQMGTKQLEKTYNPSGMEDRIYHRWLEKGYFHAQVNPDKKTIYHHHAAAEYHRAAAHGTCA